MTSGSTEIKRRYVASKTVRGAKSLLKTVHLAELLIKEHLKNNRGSTLREIYYISETRISPSSTNRRKRPVHRGPGNRHQPASRGLSCPTKEDGAAVFGPLRLREQTRRGEREMHCQEDVGEAGYQIPFNVDNIQLPGHDAKIVIAIETGRNVCSAYRKRH